MTVYEQGAVLEHKNDHFIQIIRNKSFLERAQNASTDSFFSMSRVSIGSYFQKDSPTIGTGLSREETDILLSKLLDMDPKDREFRNIVQKFYMELFTPVPPSDPKADPLSWGLRLNIGMLEDNKAPVSETNLPINLMDYIRYRHALGHRWVAATPNLAQGNQMIKFFVSDPLINADAGAEQGDINDRALSIYLSVKSNENKVDMLLTMLGVDPVAIVKNKPGKKAAIKQAALKALSQSKPDLFIKTYDTDNFSSRYLVRALINAKIWITVANKVLDGKSNAVIGESETGAVLWLNDPAHSNRTMIYKASLQDYLQKPIPAWKDPKDEEKEPVAAADEPEAEPETTTKKPSK